MMVFSQAYGRKHITVLYGNHVFSSTANTIVETIDIACFRLGKFRGDFCTALMLSGLLLTLHSRRSCSSGIEDGYPPVLCRRALIRQFWKMPKLGPVQTAHHPLAIGGAGGWLFSLLFMSTQIPTELKTKKGTQIPHRNLPAGGPAGLQKGGN
jgi:hypothetical protein